MSAELEGQAKLGEVRPLYSGTRNQALKKRQTPDSDELGQNDHERE